jgi:hypothetical protein
MKFEDALRKIRLLRAVKPENGASDAEVENAANLVQSLMDRFAVRPEDAAPVRPPIFRMSWVYWEQLCNEYGLELTRFGKRGSARIGTDRIVLMRLETGEWRVQRSAHGVDETIAQDRGVETLRIYLSRNTSRIYSLAQNAPGVYRSR